MGGIPEDLVSLDGAVREDLLLRRLPSKLHLFLVEKSLHQVGVRGENRVGNVLLVPQRGLDIVPLEDIVQLVVEDVQVGAVLLDLAHQPLLLLYRQEYGLCRDYGCLLGVVGTRVLLRLALGIDHCPPVLVRLVHLGELQVSEFNFGVDNGVLDAALGEVLALQLGNDSALGRFCLSAHGRGNRVQIGIMVGIDPTIQLYILLLVAMLAFREECLCILTLHVCTLV